MISDSINVNIGQYLYMSEILNLWSEWQMSSHVAKWLNTYIEYWIQ